MYKHKAYNFGSLPPMPPGYMVAWYDCHEHYQATGPGDWEGDISVDPYWCRRQALHHANKQEAKAQEVTCRSENQE